MNLEVHLNENALPWIKAGYSVFSQKGPDALKVELLARETGISKSSFYHHFADMDIFTQFLMQWHLKRAGDVAQGARQCKTFNPDFLLLLSSHKEDLLFNRQLRIYRDNISYQLCYERAHSLVEKEILDVWAEAIGMSDQKNIARNVFKVITDIFYQRITAETLTYEWIEDFLKEFYRFLDQIIRSSGVMSQVR